MIVEVCLGTTFTPIWIALEWVTTGVKVVSLSPAVRCVGKDELPKKAPKFGNTITKAW